MFVRISDLEREADKESDAWKPWERHVILAYDDHDSNWLLADAGQREKDGLPAAAVVVEKLKNSVDVVVDEKTGKSASSNGECQTTLEQSLNELQLMRVELRGL